MNCAYIRDFIPFFEAGMAPGLLIARFVLRMETGRIDRVLPGRKTDMDPASTNWMGKRTFLRITGSGINGVLIRKRKICFFRFRTCSCACCSWRPVSVWQWSAILWSWKLIKVLDIPAGVCYSNQAVCEQTTAGTPEWRSTIGSRKKVRKRVDMKNVIWYSNIAVPERG